MVQVLIKEKNMSTTPSIPFSEARINLTDLVNKVAYGGKRIILTRKGRKLVAIVPLDDLDTIEALENKLDRAAAEKAKEDMKKHRTISWKKAKRKLHLKRR
jgi:prevent-host-death family protein